MIQGTYTISGTYCEPEVQNATRANTIQFLAHPATYDRYYVSHTSAVMCTALPSLLTSIQWFGGNYSGIDGTRYSWVSLALQAYDICDHTTDLSYVNRSLPHRSKDIQHSHMTDLATERQIAPMEWLLSKWPPKQLP